jgi:oxygen-dependent protoporphyrinogen oxidase
MSARVAVVGGGIAGLAAAWELSQASGDLEVVLVEGAGRVGGKLRQERIAGALLDVGAESVLARRPEAMALIEEVGLGSEVVHPAPVGASIVSRGRRWPMPGATVMGIPADPDSVRGLLSDAEVERLRREEAGPAVSGDVAVGRFVDDRLGPAVTDRLVEPLLAGVYAGHSRELSLEMSVPTLFQAAREGRSLLEAAASAASAAAATADASGARPPVFASLHGGIGRLPAHLADQLSARGVEVRVGTTVRGLRRDPAGWTLTTGPTIAEAESTFDAVVLAAPATATARLLASAAPRSAGLLRGIEYASMAIVTFVLDGPPPEWLDGSGLLVPPTEGLTIKASTFSSVKWTWLQEAYPDLTFLRASIGRHREEATLQRSDADLVQVTLDDLGTVLGRDLPAPVDTHVQRWGGGLPQYAPGHRVLVERARAGLPVGLALGGAAYDGVGIPTCVGSGRRAATRVLTHLRERVGGLG